MSAVNTPTPTEQQLELKFESIISPRRPLATISEPIMALDAHQQTFTLHWIDVIASSNLELSYSFACLASDALNKLKQKGTRSWLLAALSIYDQQGLYPAIKQLQALDQFARTHRKQHASAAFTDVQHHLGLILQGLSGRQLQLAVADSAYTDTETIFLPAKIDRFDSLEQNKRLYKAQAVFLWAQSRYGTFKRATVSSLGLWDRLADYPEPALAEAHFLLLESIRLMAKMQAELPGLAREMNALSPINLPTDSTWNVFERRLQASTANVETTFSVLDDLIKLGMGMPAGYLFQGRFALQETQEAMQSRHQRELSELSAQMSDAEQTAGNEATADEGDQNTDDDVDGDSEQQTDENTDPPSLAPSLQALINSLLQDFDDVPDINDFVGSQAHTPTEQDDESIANISSEIDTELGNASYFDEWDHVRQSYRQKWCRVLEREIPSLDNRYRDRVINKYPHLVKAIHRIFDGIRDEPVLLKKQTHGDEIDIDALIAATVDRLSGQEISDRLYLRRNHNERSISLFILVDVSGSTKGWINEAERESLILICEALDRLNDRYAIYAFSGMTHERCEIFPLKRFEQSNDTEVQSRIGGLIPRYYTRMGAAIRYANKAISEEVAKHRILLVLSDGKPDDYDGYKGEYGIEDTRKALLEARAIGIKPFCITIDSEAQSYLPHLFGEGGYTLLDDVGKLPLKIADIYRRLSAGA